MTTLMLPRLCEVKYDFKDDPNLGYVPEISPNFTFSNKFQSATSYGFQQSVFPLNSKQTFNSQENGNENDESNYYYKIDLPKPKSELADPFDSVWRYPLFRKTLEESNKAAVPQVTSNTSNMQPTFHELSHQNTQFFQRPAHVARYRSYDEAFELLNLDQDKLNDSNDSNKVRKVSFPSGKWSGYKLSEFENLRMAKRSQTLKSFNNYKSGEVNEDTDTDTDPESRRNEAFDSFYRESPLRRHKTEMPLGFSQHRKSQEGSSLYLGYINLINQSRMLPKYLTPTIKLKSVEKKHKERTFESSERRQVEKAKRVIKEKFVLKPFKPKPVKKPQVPAEPPKAAKEQVPDAVLSNVKTKPSQPRTPLPLESLPKPKKIKQAIKPVQPPPSEPKKVETHPVEPPKKKTTNKTKVDTAHDFSLHKKNVSKPTIEKKPKSSKKARTTPDNPEEAELGIKITERSIASTPESVIVSRPRKATQPRVEPVNNERRDSRRDIRKNSKIITLNDNMEDIHESDHVERPRGATREKRTKMDRLIPISPILSEEAQVNDEPHDHDFVHEPLKASTPVLVQEHKVEAKEDEPIEFVKLKPIETPVSRRSIGNIHEKKMTGTKDIVTKAYKEPKKKEKKQTRPKIDVNSLKIKNKKTFIIKEDGEESDESDEELDFGDDWLKRWCILRDNQRRTYENVFHKYDTEKTGFLNGEDLILAVKSIFPLNNLQMDYLLSIMFLCDRRPFTEGADLKLFTIMTGLAQRIQFLDTDWFSNLLPKLDLASIENKVFKVKNLWNHLVEPQSRTISIEELMVEFEAGGVTFEHVQYARAKFAHKKCFDLLDYLSYIPLFIYMHDRIIANPLDAGQDI